MSGSWEQIIHDRRKSCLESSVVPVSVWELRIFPEPISTIEARKLVRSGQPFVVKGTNLTQQQHLVDDEKALFSFLRKTVGQRQVPVEKGSEVIFCLFCLKMLVLLTS